MVTRVIRRVQFLSYFSVVLLSMIGGNGLLGGAAYAASVSQVPNAVHATHLPKPLGQELVPPPSINEIIAQKLKATLFDVKIDSIIPTVIPNVYEVVSGRKVFYVDSTARYVLLGNLVDLQQKRSLTQEKVELLSVVNWDLLPLNLAIRRVIGTGARKIAIFTDPDCPFCKELEQNTIPKLKDVTIYYYLFPLAMHTNAKVDAQKILCSETPEKTYLEWMVNSEVLPTKTNCELARSLPLIEQLGVKVVGVEATPLIVLPNGKLVSGLVPPDYLNQLIDDTQPKIMPKITPKAEISAKK